VEEADFGGRSADRSEGSPFHSSVAGRRGGHRCLSQACAAATRRLLYALQPTLPHLTHSSPHRCLQRHGISRLPDLEGDKAPKKKFTSYPIGYFHIDIAEVQTAEGKLHMFVAIDCTSKFAFAQLVEKANRVTASAFLVALIKPSGRSKPAGRRRTIRCRPS